MYKFFRNILFWFDAEQVHYFSMNLLKAICRIRFLRNSIAKKYTPLDSPVNVFGLQFRNPVGLAAGFDKNARYLAEIQILGFGFIEIGTVTPLPQKGNDKPRLFRLPKDKALINRMGFNNDGIQVIAKRLQEWKYRQPATGNTQLIVGGNIGKNKNTPNEDAWKDYETCFNGLFEWVDYFVVNVSSPNTPGLRELQQKDSLRKILSVLQNSNQQKAVPKPLLFKISPDMGFEDIKDAIDLAVELQLDGIVAANTTISREDLSTSGKKINAIGSGGLSGKPLQEISTSLIKTIYEKANKQLPVIASGGIFTGDDANEKIMAGAKLIQVWTGFIYEGPAIVKNICKALS
jgi:dihydroorotate dehydrogenase